MVPEKSSIGLISSKISSRPDCSGILTAGLLRFGDAGLPVIVSEEPVEGLGLQGKKVGNLEGLFNAREGDATRTESVS